jgi:hypothetical protein
LRHTDRFPPPSDKDRKQRLAEALRANLLRRKMKTADDASQNSKNSDDQPVDEDIEKESGR